MPRNRGGNIKGRDRRKNGEGVERGVILENIGLRNGEAVILDTITELVVRQSRVVEAFPRRPVLSG